jgi:hypothetical protein
LQSALVKVDVEGMELAVLRGAEELIRRCCPVLYLENNEEPGVMKRRCRELGYDRNFDHRFTVRWVDEFREAGSDAPASRVLIGNIQNLLCISGQPGPADHYYDHRLRGGQFSSRFERA